MTFKELKIGDFFIPSKRSKLCLKFGTVLLQKTDEKEVRSMSSAAYFSVHHQHGLIKPNESVIKVVLSKHVLSAG